MLALCVLLWGHLIVRKRRFIHTPFEMISPVMGVFFLFLLKGGFQALFREIDIDLDKVQQSMLSDEYPIEAISSPSMVYYTPVTPATRALMRQVGQKLGLSEIQHVPGDFDFNSVYGVHNVSNNIRIVSEKLGQHDAFVIFENANSVPLERLNYTIRMKSDFHRSQSGADTAHEKFLRLQWAIDTSFMERRSGTAIPTNVTFHEVDPKNKKKPNMAVLMMLIFILLLNRFALMIPFVTLMVKFVEEKVTGHQELLKMINVRMRTVILGHLINMLPTGLSYSLISPMFMKITGSPMIPHTVYAIIALIYFLHFYAMMQWALLCTFVVNTENYITTKSSMMYIALNIPGFFANAITNRAAVFAIACFTPYVSIDQFFSEVMQSEIKHDGINFSNMWSSQDKTGLSASDSIWSLMVQFLLLGCLVLWLSRVRPGPFGVPEPYTTAIPFYNKIIKKREDNIELEQTSVPRDPKYFENPPKKEIGIKICNVTKVFGEGEKRFQALTNVSFDIYRGEIMVLLGHNGAGKTTLLSIVTGMIPPTLGKVYVSGEEVDKSQSKVRQEMGYCTQHNTFMSYLTILEQVRFWSMLKGQSCNEANNSSRLLLAELNISDQANQKSQQLSGGMKRRLQLACALGGGSTVLVLDEPTSGLDVETRRQLWDLLLTLRGTRTMVLTTHYMEEADALGDRVAALHQGILKCHATPMHLKKNVGSGYRLTIMTRGPPKEAEITSIVTSSLGGASLKDKTTIQVTYDLPDSETAKFPDLFEKLEGQQKELDIESMGVSMPSLEEVFLRLCSNVETDFIEDKQMAGLHMADYKKATGFTLYKNQAVVLLKRHVRFMLDKKWSYLIWHVLLPVALVFAVVYVHYDFFPFIRKQNQSELGATRRSGMQDRLRHPVFRRMYDPDALFHAEDETNLKTTAESLADVKFTEISDNDEVLTKGKMQLIHDDNYLAGLLLNSTHAKIMFKKGMYDVASVALNLLSNILAAGQFGDTRRSIHTSHHPVTVVQTVPQLPKATDISHPEDIRSLMIYMVVITCIMTATASAITSRERQTGTRSIYIMSGCSVPVFWTVRLLYFLVFYTFVLLLPLLIAFLCFKSSRMMWTFEPIAVLAIAFWCGYCAWLTFIFLLGLAASERAATFIALALTFVFGYVVPTFGNVFGSYGGKLSSLLSVLNATSYVMTPGTLLGAIERTGMVALTNAYCDVNRHLCPLLAPIVEPFDYGKCCLEKKRMAEYFSFNAHSPLIHILLLIVQFVVFMTFLLLIDKGWFHNKCKRNYNQPPPQFSNPLVNAEKAYVYKTFYKSKNEIKDVMLVNNLHKKFCSKKIPAVRGVNFSVKQGECFGVLGVNGAGKTTTFRMIVGEISSSDGTCFANKHYLSTERQAYLRSLSYCPQFLGLDTYMTGYQNLNTLLTIRGLNKEDMEKEINLCFDVVGLQQYRDKKVSEYSGGCMRRLGAGAALSGGAALTLLDEPTCGVDVAARRRVWANIKQSLQQGRAVIITSHSMDEMETLSNRLMIMARGEVCLLGSPGALRASLAAGHAVVLKLSSAVPADGSGVQELKTEMNQIFNCTLKDEHQTMLHYHINETKKNSELFREMETLKAKFSDLIEDYSVSATSLEEVFLSIAQKTNASQLIKI